MIEPVQPRPMMTTSLRGSLRAMDGWCGSAARYPARCARDGHRRMRIALVVPIDPVAIVVVRTGVADHLPGTHGAIAPVERIGEEAGLQVHDEVLEEVLRIDPLELDRAALESRENHILPIGGHLDEGLAVLERAGVLVERGEPASIQLCGRLRVLLALRLAAFLKRALAIEALRLAIGPCELPIEKHGAARLPAARTPLGAVVGCGPARAGRTAGAARAVRMGRTARTGRVACCGSRCGGRRGRCGGAGHRDRGAARAGIRRNDAVGERLGQRALGLGEEVPD